MVATILYQLYHKLENYVRMKIFFLIQVDGKPRNEDKKKTQFYPHR